MRSLLIPVVLAVTLAQPLEGQSPTSNEALTHSVEQLRSAIGRWDVTTDFLNPDGTSAQVVEGIYTFEWVVPDRVVSGKSELPSLDQASGILFYINEAAGEIEMVSVGADGRLWVMTGPLGGETRQTPEVPTADGGSMALRFTRFNVGPDSFESRMEYTTDGGRTWTQGNHQLFRRVMG